MAGTAGHYEQKSLSPSERDVWQKLSGKLRHRSGSCPGPALECISWLCQAHRLRHSQSGILGCPSRSTLGSIPLPLPPRDAPFL